jgi:NADH:ubiquinone reductase (H+-translocating)
MSSQAIRLDRYDVIVLGAGYAGLMAALRLSQRKLKLRVALVNAEEPFVERVRLQESIVAPVKPRIPSLTAWLARTLVNYICGTVISLDTERKTVRLRINKGESEIGFDQAIYALGSRVDVAAVSGGADHAYRLDPGEGSHAAAALRTKLRDNARRPIRVIVVGGGALSIEAAAEIKSTWPAMQVSLISASRAGDFSSAKVEKVLRRDLTRLGVALVDNQTVTEVRRDEIVAKGGLREPCDICIWAGGMQAAPIARAAGIEVDTHDRILVGPHLHSVSHPHILAVGDSCHPLAPTGAPYRLSALAAAVSGVYAAEAIIAERVGRHIPPFSYSPFAQAIAVGRYAVLFPLDANDRQILFVTGGRVTAYIRSVLIWLVTYFIKFERTLPGVQTLLGRHRVSQAEADDAMKKAQSHRM